MVFWILALIAFEILLWATVGNNLADPMFRLKRLKNSYVPSIQAKQTFYFKISEHPWISDFKWQKIVRNPLGFRGRDIVNPFSKKTKEVRVFLVGDSFFADHFHGEEECLTTLVQQKLDREFAPASVIVNTTAFSGESNSDLFSVLIHQILHLQPDIVLVTPETRTVRIRPLNVLPQQKYFGCWETFLMFLSNSKVVQLLYLLISLPKKQMMYFKKGIRYHLLNVHTTLVQPTLKRKVIYTPVPQFDESAIEKLVNVFDAITKMLACKLIVVLRDHRADLQKKTDEEENDYFWTWRSDENVRYKQHEFAKAYEEYNRAIINKCKERNLEVLNLYNSLSKEKSHWVDDTHPLLGIDILATKIADCLKPQIKKLLDK